MKRKTSKRLTEGRPEVPPGHFTPDTTRSTMQVRTLIATALLSLSAAAVMADPAVDSTTNAVGTTHYSTTSQRTRSAVVAELRNTQAAGDLQRAGELSEAPVAAVVPVPGSPITRSEVRAELAQARAHHELRFSEMM
jgi:hypothetical protein